MLEKIKRLLLSHDIENRRSAFELIWSIQDEELYTKISKEIVVNDEGKIKKFFGAPPNSYTISILKICALFKKEYPHLCPKIHHVSFFAQNYIDELPDLSLFPIKTWVQGGETLPSSLYKCTTLQHLTLSRASKLPKELFNLTQLKTFTIISAIYFWPQKISELPNLEKCNITL